MPHPWHLPWFYDTINSTWRTVTHYYVSLWNFSSFQSLPPS
jgi:hypothetical protein